MTTASDTAAAGHAVTPRARQLAGRLSVLFDQDIEIVKRLNDAHHHLANTNQHLAEPAPDPRGLPGLHRQIHRAFCAYQDAAEQRRQLAVDIGGLAQQLTDALTATGWTPDQARHANVHELANSASLQGGEFP